MDTKLGSGGFALDQRGRPYLVGGLEEAAQRILIRLTVPRGSFGPNPELGSRLRQLPRGTGEEMSQWARYAIEEALYPMAEVTLETVDCAYDPGRDRAELRCAFRVREQPLELELAL